MTDIEKLHEKLLEILDYVDKICRENDIKYSLCGGTMLGAVRHKGFIPWDDDLDIMLLASDYKRLIKILKEKPNEKFVLQEGTVDYPLYFSKVRMNGTAFIEKNHVNKRWRNMHQGIYIDLFPYYYTSKNKIHLFFQALFSRILVAQSLFSRGYENASFKKQVFMRCSLLLLPFRKIFFRIVSGVKKEDASGVVSFFGATCLPSKVVQNIDLLDEIETMDFENRKMPVSKYYKSYLEKGYGDYMTPPPENERVATMHCVYFSDSIDYRDYLKNKEQSV